MTTFVDDYVRQVEAACADLPPEQRRRLVADLSAHLHEIGTATGNVYAELGPPEAYARELREALGLPPAGAAASTEFGPPRLIAVAARAPGRPRVHRALRVLAVIAVVFVVLALVVLLLLARPWVETTFGLAASGLTTVTALSG